jgi:CheY-like chemotaxis protein
MTTLLELWNQHVRVVNNGHDALAAALEFQPNVVLLDIGLPGMDGFEIARRIRATPELRDVRLIAITGYGQSHDRQRALDVGFDAHLVKPVQPETLHTLLSATGA